MQKISTAPSSLLFVLTLSLACPDSVSATTVREHTFSDLVHRAEIIAVGTVTAIHEQWDTVRQAPFTLVTLSHMEILKGNPDAEELTLHFLGGHTPAGTILTVAGMPRFSLGEKTLVFSTGNQRDFCPLVGLWQGVFRVVFDAQRGIETVSDHSYVPIVGIQDGKVLKLTPQTAERRPLPFQTLKQRIEQELRRTYDQP